MKSPLHRTFLHRSRVGTVVVGLAVCALAGCSSAPSANPSNSVASTAPAATTTTGPTKSPTSTPSPTTTPSVGPTGTQPPGRTVALTSSATFADGVSGRVERITEVTVKAGVGPGQTAGKALTVTLALHNGSGQSINLDSAVVTIAVGAARLPGDPVDGSPSKPFAGDLAAGGSTTAIYAFRVDNPGPGPITVTVSYSPVKPPITFAGSRN